MTNHKVSLYDKYDTNEWIKNLILKQGSCNSCIYVEYYLAQKITRILPAYNSKF